VLACVLAAAQSPLIGKTACSEVPRDRLWLPPVTSTRLTSDGTMLTGWASWEPGKTRGETGDKRDGPANLPGGWGGRGSAPQETDCSATIRRMTSTDAAPHAIAEPSLCEVLAEQAQAITRAASSSSPVRRTALQLARILAASDSPAGARAAVASISDATARRIAVGLLDGIEASHTTGAVQDPGSPHPGKPLSPEMHRAPQPGLLLAPGGLFTVMIIKRHARRRRWPELDQRIVDDLVNNPPGSRVLTNAPMHVI
jgi:hypothetical protein